MHVKTSTPVYRRKLEVHPNPGGQPATVAAWWLFFKLIPLTGSQKDRESNSRRFWSWTDLLPADWYRLGSSSTIRHASDLDHSLAEFS